MQDAQETENERYAVQAESRRGGQAQAHARGQAIPFSTTGAEDVAGPAELLGASLAACLLKNLERMSSLLRFEFTAAQVDVVLERQPSPPRFVGARYHLTIETEEPGRRLALLHKNLRKFGTVVNTLGATLPIEGHLTARRADGSLEEAPHLANDAEGA